jgi:aspartyl protease family protein
VSDNVPNAIYYVMIIVFVASALISMRLPVGRAVRMAAAWVAIFGVAFVLFAFRGEFTGLFDRLRAEATGAAIVSGGEVRVPVADDGHFWVDATVNGRPARFLVDSGASITTVSDETARAAGIRTDGRIRYIDTANGPAQVRQSYADKLAVGPIERTDFPIDVNSRDRTNILGMNFLRTLRGWRVEGHDLVLSP